jgi:hypothetical protein
MTYKINDVGDACCIQIGKVTNNELLLDFGFSNDEKFNRFLGQLCNFEEKLGTKLLVSHYHIDHFNGLIKFAERGEKLKSDIDEVYLPFIPQFDDSSDYNLLSKQIVFSFCLQSGYPLFKESPALYIEESVKKINKSGKKPVSKIVKQGDQINIENAIFDVIWPPAKITKKDDLRSLKGQIKKIDTIIENSPYLKNLWNKFERKREQSDCIDKIVSDESNKANTTEVKKLVEIIKGVTNRFSICLFQPGLFLFLGDLEKKEIDAAINYLKEKHLMDSIYILVPPHHGTHWSSRINDIRVENLVVSNGKLRSRGFNENYKHISEKCFSTFLNGTIIFGTEQDDYVLDSLPCYKKIKGIYFV